MHNASDEKVAEPVAIEVACCKDALGEDRRCPDLHQAYGRVDRIRFLGSVTRRNKEHIDPSMPRHN